MFHLINWCLAWIIQIPHMDHKAKYFTLCFLQDPDFHELLRAKMLVYQVKKLCM
jgi:hypothetical protein